MHSNTTEQMVGLQLSLLLSHVLLANYKKNMNHNSNDWAKL